jgi:hypothetical protein
LIWSHINSNKNWAYYLISTFLRKLDKPWANSKLFEVSSTSLSDESIVWACTSIELSCEILDGLASNNESWWLTYIFEWSDEDTCILLRFKGGTITGTVDELDNRDLLRELLVSLLIADSRELLLPLVATERDEVGREEGWEEDGRLDEVVDFPLVEAEVVGRLDGGLEAVIEERLELLTEAELGTLRDPTEPLRETGTDREIDRDWGRGCGTMRGADG